MAVQIPLLENSEQRAGRSSTWSLLSVQARRDVSELFARLLIESVRPTVYTEELTNEHLEDSADASTS